MKIFLSWCHRNKPEKEALLFHLEPALGLFSDVTVEWWADSHLNCGEQLMPGIIDRLDEADFGLLLASPQYLKSRFIRQHELPRFAGPDSDKGALPVKLTPMPRYDGGHDLGGLEKLIVFERDSKSFAEMKGVQRNLFANELADSIMRRVRGQDGFRVL
ncbi:hypothetical protein [Amycolatopsis sp. MEPSY49]|uniref:hypothetical protein n=1 Tax=Amycolatopsis sp. MEPSY49 TaxID=3151600 RepID=UPI003EF267AE